MSIGVAAHITAAAPGGKRYDVSMTAAERASPENGIWLCQDDAKLIDSDEVRFPTAVLLDWKRLAEATVREEMEGRSPRTPGHPSGALLDRLIAEYREKANDGGDFQEVIEELEHWAQNVDPVVRGLEAKLRESNRSHELRNAERSKEAFTKKLAKHQFSETGQQIFALLLAETEERFRAKVAPAIRDGASPSAVDQLVHIEVVDSMMHLLGKNELLVLQHHVRGMLYFLTGNCHIEWK